MQLRSRRLLYDFFFSSSTSFYYCDCAWEMLMNLQLWWFRGMCLRIQFVIARLMVMELLTVLVLLLLLFCLVNTTVWWWRLCGDGGGLRERFLLVLLLLLLHVLVLFFLHLCHGICISAISVHTTRKSILIRPFAIFAMSILFVSLQSNWINFLWTTQHRNSKQTY